MHERLFGKRLLLADNQDCIRAGVPPVLAQEGLDIHISLDDHEITIPRSDRLNIHMGKSGADVWRILRAYPNAFDGVIIDLLGMDEESEFNPARDIPSLARTFPHIPFIVFSVESRFARQYFEAGVQGYVVKDDQTPCLAMAIERVLVENEVYCSPKVRQDGRKLFTLQEREILSLAAEGHKQDVIAKHMDMSKSSVEKAIYNIRGKLEAKNLTHAVALAVRQGIISS